MSEKFSDLVETTFRWPSRGDRLFVDAGHRMDQAEIHSEADARSYFMTDGYKRAADLLVEKAIENRFERNRLVYPILFCYRQFIELSLKGQISAYGTYVGVDLPTKQTHDLRVLLKRYRRMCLRFAPGDMAPMIVVSKCILEFARMDATSFTFRYATAKSGAPYPVLTDRLDLERLRDTMEGMGDFFSGSDGYYTSLIDAGP